MRHTLSVVVVLALIWLLNSGLYKTLIVILGFISIAFVTWLTSRMNVIDEESQPVYLTKKLPAYYWWLLGKIIKSNIDVVYRIWRGNNSISPTVIAIDTSQATDMGKVVYANSITLTPGTVSMDLKQGVITVHALTKANADEIRAGEMDRRVKQLEE